MGVNFFVSSTIAILFLSVDYVTPGHVGSDHHWDFLIFTQSWPITVCREWKEKNVAHKCALPKNAFWSIHGIWPTQVGKIGPAFCNNSWHFDQEQIKPIEGPLLDKWLNIELDTSTYAFWGHEWSKHGTCAAVLNSLNSEYKYFNQGLNWLEQHSMTSILNSAGILPSNTRTYSVQQINNAIKQRLGVNPAIECRKEHGHSYLAELRICFNKNLQLQTCDGAVAYNDNIITNCESQGNIYPVDPSVFDPPESIFVHLFNLVRWVQWATL